MKFRFLSPPTLGVITFVVLILALLVLQQMNPLAAIAVVVLSLAVIALTGNLGQRARLFYGGYALVLLFIGSLLAAIVIYQAVSGAPAVGMLVGSERLQLVQSEAFQTGVLDHLPAQLDKNQLKTVGSLGQAAAVAEGSLDLKTTQLFWSGDVGQAESLTAALKEKGQTPDSAETFYDPFVVVIEAKAAQTLAAAQAAIAPLTNDPLFAYEIDAAWMAEVLAKPDLTWAQVGLADYQEPIKIVSSNPVTSGGGQLSLVLFTYFWDRAITGTPGIDLPLNPEVAAKIQYFTEGVARQRSSGEILNELTRRGYTPWGITYQSAALTEKDKWQDRFVLAKLTPTIVSSNVMVGIGDVGLPLIQQLKIEGSPIHEGMLQVGKQFNYLATDPPSAITPPSRRQLLAVQRATGLCQTEGGEYVCQ